RPEPCACELVSFVIGRSKYAASSAIQRAQFESMFGWLIHSSRDHFANAHNSTCTETGFAFAAVHALLPRFTYSPIVPALSSIPTCELTPELELAKKLPSSSIVRAPSAVWITISRTPAPPRDEWFGDGIAFRLSGPCDSCVSPWNISQASLMRST